MILFSAIPQHRLNRHGAVHQADAGVGGVAVYTYFGKLLVGEKYYMSRDNYLQILCSLDLCDVANYVN